jgi:WD40 repeat protein
VLAGFLGHRGIVNDARFDPGGNRVVTAGQDGTAAIWDAQTGDPLVILNGNTGPINCAVFRPGGSQVATANGDGTVSIWDATDGSELFVLPDSVPEGQVTNLVVLSLLFSQDGNRLVAAGQDGSVTVWDTNTGASLLRINAHGRGIIRADLSSDGNRIVSASFFAGLARVWIGADGSELATLNHGSIINDVAITSDGTTVATVGTDSAARVWNATGGELLVVLEGHTGPIYTGAFSPNGEELVTAGADGTARIWNPSIAAQEREVRDAFGPPPPLSYEGPWWVSAGAGGLWAVNIDGTGATQISERDFGHDLNIRSWAAPRGGRLAYITVEDSCYDAVLHITSLPALEDDAIIRLTVDATKPTCDAGPGDPALDAVSVAIRDDSIAWSPDGRWLAFNAMIEGPTSDLYVYDTITHQITRLTDGPTQAARPLWSRDGRLILHTALEGANIDAGMRVQAYWVAAPDGSGVTLVHEGEDELVGWTSAREFALYSTDTLCGEHDLRIVDLDGGERTIWQGYLDRVAVDPESGTVLVAIWAETAPCNDDQRPGLYVTNTDGVAPIRIVEDEVREIVWSPEAQLFFARTDYGILAVALSGEFIDLVVPEGSFDFPQVALGTRELAWRGAGLWVGALTSSLDHLPQQIYPDRTIQAQWTPDGAHVLFITAEGSLHIAQRPDFVPVYVTEVGTASSAVWLVP